MASPPLLAASSVRCARRCGGVWKPCAPVLEDGTSRPTPSRSSTSTGRTTTARSPASWRRARLRQRALHPGEPFGPARRDGCVTGPLRRPVRGPARWRRARRALPPLDPRQGPCRTPGPAARDAERSGSIGRFFLEGHDPAPPTSGPRSIPSARGRSPSPRARGAGRGAEPSSRSSLRRGADRPASG